MLVLITCNGPTRILSDGYSKPFYAYRIDFFDEAPPLVATIWLVEQFLAFCAETAGRIDYAQPL